MLRYPRDHFSTVYELHGHKRYPFAPGMPVIPAKLVPAKAGSGNPSHGALRSSKRKRPTGFRMTGVKEETRS